MISHFEPVKDQKKAVKLFLLCFGGYTKTGFKLAFLVFWWLLSQNPVVLNKLGLSCAKLSTA